MKYTRIPIKKSQIFVIKEVRLHGHGSVVTLFTLKRKPVTLQAAVAVYTSGPDTWEIIMFIIKNNL